MPVPRAAPLPPPCCLSRLSVATRGAVRGAALGDPREAIEGLKGRAGPCGAAREGLERTASRLVPNPGMRAFKEGERGCPRGAGDTAAAVLGGVSRGSPGRCGLAWGTPHCDPAPPGATSAGASCAWWRCWAGAWKRLKWPLRRGGDDGTVPGATAGVAWGTDAAPWGGTGSEGARGARGGGRVGGGAAPGWCGARKRRCGERGRATPSWGRGLRSAGPCEGSALRLPDPPLVSPELPILCAKGRGLSRVYACISSRLDGRAMAREGTLADTQNLASGGDFKSGERETLPSQQPMFSVAPGELGGGPELARGGTPQGTWGRVVLVRRTTSVEKAPSASRTQHQRLKRRRARGSLARTVLIPTHTALPTGTGRHSFRG